MADIDLGLLALEAECEPLLLLAPVAPAPRLANQVGRQIVGEPAGRLPEQAHVTDRGLLVKFTQRRLIRVFALIEAALRHLPPVALASALVFLVGTVTDPDEAGRIEQRNADARAIGQGRDVLRLLHERGTIALTGTSVMPLSAAALAKAATRSMVIGKAVAVASA